MPQFRPKPAEAPWLIPYLTVKDARAAIEFYTKAFGFDPGMVLDGPDGGVMHAEINYKGQTLFMMAPEGAGMPDCKAPATSGQTPPTSLYVYVDDVNAHHDHAKSAGVEILEPLTDQFWGDRTYSAQDPDGYIWMFGSNLSDFDPSKIPG